MAVTSIDPIRDIRFEGMDIPQLQEWITQIKQGRGAESMHGAVRALDECVKVVVELDETLRRELGKLQIAWEGNAGSLAAAATQQQSVFLADAPDPLKASATSVDAQGRGYESAKNRLPNNDELRHKESENIFEKAGGYFGYESDYDAEAKAIDAQKKAAQAALSSYRDTSVHQADSFRPLPEMPALTVAAAAAPPSVAGSGIGSIGSPVGGGGSAQGDVSGGFVGGNTRGGDVGDGTKRGDRTPPPPGGDRSGTKEPQERDHAGSADPTPGGDDQGSGIGMPGVLGIAAGGAAVAGLGAYAASRMLGGRSAAVGAGGGTVRGGGLEGRSPGMARGGSSGIGGGPGDTQAGKAAGNTPGSRPGAGSMMTPAATRGEKRAEDAEHENKYVAEETPFDDERLVAPPVLGQVDEPDDDTEPKKQD
ncbi:PPE domain-containing protein [Saccharopolyspora thermophila]|uniref:PPE domain-containing protein n=1 Tax=Saccharopolyspora thermophila TaxID=89367 RepID=UPI003D15700E